MPPIRLLSVSGKPYQMGFQHGRVYAEAIREIAEERLHLSSDPIWTGRHLSRRAVLDLAEVCVEEHYAYSPELMHELEGMSLATGVSLPKLIIANGFTDFVDAVYNADSESVYAPRAANECTTFMVGGERTLTEQAMIGQTWDMHNTATSYVIMLQGAPQDAPRFMTFTLTGCLGMIGMNEHGISITINNLLASTGQIGVTWPFVMRKMLMQDNLSDALACLTSAKLAGAHNYMLMDAEGNGYNVEAMPNTMVIEPLKADPITHANRCLYPVTQREERELDDDWIIDSDLRSDRAYELLDHAANTPETLMSLTRDRAHGEYSICAVAEAPYFSETCGALLMRPQEREFWGVWGLPNQNEYQRFTL